MDLMKEGRQKRRKKRKENDINGCRLLIGVTLTRLTLAFVLRGSAPAKQYEGRLVIYHLVSLLDAPLFFLNFFTDKYFS